MAFEKQSRILLRPSEKRSPRPYPNSFETDGFFGNVIFSNGIVERDDKVFVYYGAADESVGVAITDIDSLLQSF